MLGALRARAPQPALIEELLNMSDADGCAAYLRQSPFLEGVETGNSQRELERALRIASITFARKLSIFLGGPARGLVQAFMLRYGVWNLKALFRGAVGARVDGASDFLYPGVPCYVSPRQRATIDVPEKAIALCEGGPLEKPARMAFDVYEKGEKDLFLFELTLDREYAITVWAAASRVNLTEGARLRRSLVAPALGLNAIIWGMWLKAYHAMSPEEAVTLLTVPSELIRPDSFVRFMQTGDVSAIVGDREVTAAGRHLAASAQPSDVAAWQRLSRRYMWSRLNNKAFGIVFDICSIVTALMKWEYIVDDAIAVTSGKALGMSREDIEPLLATRAA
jgi:vacuolar-type H+-ATPase subunit C/Vma6